jgi:hypothetical protein
MPTSMNIAYLNFGVRTPGPVERLPCPVEDPCPERKTERVIERESLTTGERGTKNKETLSVSAAPVHVFDFEQDLEMLPSSLICDHVNRISF